MIFVKALQKGGPLLMRTLNEILERKAYLEWFRHDLAYEFATTPLSRYWYTVASAYFRTLDNEIDMLRWVLGELENTWQDDMSKWMSLLEVVQEEPQTRYPHLPAKADYHTFWGKLPRVRCRYFYGPDSPKDDQSFPFDQVQDPGTWDFKEFLAYHRYPRRGLVTRFGDPLPGAVGDPYWEGRSGPLWMAYELGEGPRPEWRNGAWTVL